jgi:3-dehydroquinate dehydratase-1
MGGSPEALLGETASLLTASPDLLELRIDAWTDAEDPTASLSLLRRLRGVAEGMPLLLTCRSPLEGGLKPVSEDAWGTIRRRALEEGLVDLVDLELRSGPDRIDEVRRLASKNEIPLILSYHDFDDTPSEEVILSLIAAEFSAGADVAKVALMPRRFEDVLALLSATLTARRRFGRPLATMSMGPLGAITRAMGWMCGSDLTFASGMIPSAPGQIPLGDLRRLHDMLFSLQ